MRALIALSGAIPSGCAAPRATASDYSVVVEVPGGAIERIPCSLAEDGIDVRMRRDRVAKFTDYPAGWTRFGAYYGISGAPVIDRDGVIVGAIAETLYDRAGPYFGIRVIEPLEQLLAEGAAARPTNSAAGSAPDERVVPGRSVVTLEVWGDLVVGVTGRIALRRGADAVATAHAVFEPHGPWVRAVALAPVAALYLSDGSGMESCALGPVVRVSTFEGTDGAYIRLGAAPPTLDLVFDVESEAPPLRYRREYHVVRDPASEARHVGDVVQRALEAREPIESDEAAITVTAASTICALGAKHFSSGEAATAIAAAIDAIRGASPEGNLAIGIDLKEGGPP